MRLEPRRVGECCGRSLTCVEVTPGPAQRQSLAHVSAARGCLERRCRGGRDRADLQIHGDDIAVVELHNVCVVPAQPVCSVSGQHVDGKHRSQFFRAGVS